VQGDDFSTLTGCFIGAVVIVGWTTLCSLVIFLPMWYFNFMRVHPDIESKGLDEVFHGGLGYYIGTSRVNTRPTSPSVK